MKFVFGLLIAIGIVTIFFFIVLYICFYMAFYSPKRKKRKADEYPLPKGEIYLPFADTMTNWMKQVREMPSEQFCVTAFDGLTLRGNFYSFSPDAPIELMFPGYRGEAERDLCGAVQRCFSLGHSALIVDQRACGISDGSIISFGINESRDVHTWLEFMIDHFGSDVKIILTGISMGAATVIMAAENELPRNVIGLLADCGYSSAPDIIKKVIKDLKLPQKALYPLVRLSGKVFGGFDVESAVPRESAKKIRVPIIIAHGETDAFVPCYMSEEIYENCTGAKKLITVPNAGHGLCYPVAPEKYLAELSMFWEKEI